MGTSKTGKLEN